MGTYRSAGRISGHGDAEQSLIQIIHAAVNSRSRRYTRLLPPVDSVRQSQDGGIVSRHNSETVGYRTSGVFSGDRMQFVERCRRSVGPFVRARPVGDACDLRAPLVRSTYTQEKEIQQLTSQAFPSMRV